jgi:hypothetical protein
MSRFMTQRLMLCCLAIAGVVAAAAEPPPAWANALPDPVAMVDGRAITRAEAVALVERRVGRREVPAREIRLVVRQALEDESCRIAVRRKLAEAGIGVGEAETLDFYRKHLKEIPAGLPVPTPEDMQKAAADPDNQLRVAVRFYIEKIAPDRLRIADADVEDFYRQHQEMFRLPAQYETTTIRTRRTPAGKAAIERAADDLRQGENWGAVAGRVGDPPAGAVPADIVRRVAAGLKPGEVSAAIELPGEYLLVRLDRASPESYVPLEPAAPHIRRILRDTRVAVELEKIVAEELEKMKIDYYF